MLARCTALCCTGRFRYGDACVAAGEALYPHVLAQEPQRAGKITGMLLELGNEAVLHLLATPAELSKDVSLLMPVFAARSIAARSSWAHPQNEYPSVL